MHVPYDLYSQDGQECVLSVSGYLTEDPVAIYLVTGTDPLATEPVPLVLAELALPDKNAVVDSSDLDTSA
jgi:hypothetical protein